VNRGNFFQIFLNFQILSSWKKNDEMEATSKRFVDKQERGFEFLPNIFFFALKYLASLWKFLLTFFVN